MKSFLDTPENTADKIADRNTFGFVALLMFLSWLLLSSSVQLEAAQDGESINWIEPWVQEFISHITLLGLVPIIPFLLMRYPLTLDNWKRHMPAYVATFFVYAVVHVFLMVGLRKLSYPALLNTSYHFGLNDPLNWIYEMRKDAFSFVLFLAGFLANRQIGQLKLESKTARDDARTNHRLTLKSGGRTIFLGADEVIWAKAASNYVEVRTQHKTHLARMTLSRLETLLAEAGDAHVQCHRSYIVNRAAIREIVPTGEGDAALLLTSGEEIPASRRYRGRLTV